MLNDGEKNISHLNWGMFLFINRWENFVFFPPSGLYFLFYKNKARSRRIWHTKFPHAHTERWMHVSVCFLFLATCGQRKRRFMRGHWEWSIGRCSSAYLQATAQSRTITQLHDTTNTMNTSLVSHISPTNKNNRPGPRLIKSKWSCEGFEKYYYFIFPFT